MEATKIPTRPTKAAMEQLESERDNARRLLARREADLAAAEAEAAAWKEVKIQDPEAEALSGCVRAIEALITSQSSGRNMVGYSTGFTPPPPTPSDTPIGRILLHLAARYGVPLAAAAAPDVDTEEPVMLSVPRRVAEQLLESGQAYRG